MRLAISNIAWPAGADAAAAPLLRAHGVEGVELALTKIWPEPLDAPAAEVRAYRDGWEKQGLRIAALQALLFGKPHLTLFSDEPTRRQMLNYPQWLTEKQPDWANFFTVWGDGKLDVNLADANMIALVTGVSGGTADKFVKYRWGPDGIPSTLDDRVYNSIDEVRAALGMTQEQFKLVQDLLSLKSAVDRIESTGIIAGYKKTIAVIASRGTTPIQYFAWQEN